MKLLKPKYFAKQMSFAFTYCNTDSKILLVEKKPTKTHRGMARRLASRYLFSAI